MRIFYIPNLVSTKTERLDIKLGDCPAEMPLPVLKDKAAYREWCNQPETDHVFLSCCEGLTPGLRINSTNPPVRIHGLVGEYDAKPQGDWLGDILKNAPDGLLPAWACQSFSGNTRLVWAFAEPVGWHEQFAKFFYPIAFKALRAKDLVLGFRADEASEPSRYFEIGRSWVCIPGATLIPAHIVDAWMVRACEKVNWKKEAVPLPIDKLREEAEKRWPGRWPGGWEKFDVGARGVRFWEQGADALSVIVRETGCTCFTGDQLFLSWANIFGDQFVRNLSDETVGKAIEGVYYCPNTGKYHWRSEVCNWQPWAKDDTRLKLIEAGLSPVVGRGEVLSRTDQAIRAIHRLRTIDGVFPAFFRDQEILEFNGKRFLNTSGIKLTQPAEGKHAWGQDFEWLANYFELLFGKQLPYYLHWLAHFYQSCLRRNPERGLTLFIAGPPGAGKSYLLNAVHKQMFGAAEDATDYLVSADKFNSHLFASPIWVVDDATASTDPKTKERFSQIVKSVTANDWLNMRGMYREGARMPWLGRLVICMNDDPESINMLPTTEMSLLDKIMLLRANATGLGKYPSDEATMEMLPAFCAFLRDVQPDNRYSDTRFGVKAFHDPLLKSAAESAQDTSAFIELLDAWGRLYFVNGVTEWQGTPTALMQAIADSNDSLADLSRRLVKDSRICGRYLRKVIARGDDWLGQPTRAGKNGDRLYKIDGKALLGN